MDRFLDIFDPLSTVYPLSVMGAFDQLPPRNHVDFLETPSIRKFHLQNRMDYL